MTILSRRRAYWFLFAISLLALGSAIVLALPAFGGSFGPSRPGGIGSSGVWRFLGLSVRSMPMAVLGGLAAAFFSTVVLASVLVSFRKTGSPEIFFFAFWVLSLGLEAGRIAVLRMAAEGWAGTWLSFATRGVLSARYAGYGAIFLSGLHASGFRTERPGRAMAIVLGLGLALASTLPLDTGVFAETLLLRPGYARVESLLVLLLALLTLANFLLGARHGGEPRYKTIAAGAVAMLAGQYLLLSDWRPPLLLLALVLLVAGSRLFVSRLHAHYLWQ